MEIATALLHDKRQTSPLTQSRVKVLVRIRPAMVSNKENDQDSKSVVVVRNNKTLELHPANIVTKVGVPTTWSSDTKMRMFSFDKVFRPRCSQSEIFNSVKNCVTLCSKGECFWVTAVSARHNRHTSRITQNFLQATIVVYLRMVAPVLAKHTLCPAKRENMSLQA